MSIVIITGSATLRELNVGDNDINDDGMAVISEALQHSKSLTTLSVVECGLSVKGIVVCACTVLKIYFFTDIRRIIKQLVLKFIDFKHSYVYHSKLMQTIIYIFRNISRLK